MHQILHKLNLGNVRFLYFVYYISQEKSRSNVSTVDVSGGLRTPLTERSTPMCTPVTSPTTARSSAVTSHTLTLALSGSI